MSALPPKADMCSAPAHVRFGPILLQKLPRRNCKIQMRNYRIGANGFLNQRCALTPNLESILHVRVRKIFLQQYRPKADIANAAVADRHTVEIHNSPDRNSAANSSAPDQPLDEGT
jgi:hypothetical protein